MLRNGLHCQHSAVHTNGRDRGVGNVPAWMIPSLPLSTLEFIGWAQLSLRAKHGLTGKSPVPEHKP